MPVTVAELLISQLQLERSAATTHVLVRTQYDLGIEAGSSHIDAPQAAGCLPTHTSCVLSLAPEC